MKILHTVSGIWNHTGGPAEVIPLLCQHLRALGHEVSIATLDGPLSDTTIIARDFGIALHTFPVTFRHSPWYSSQMGKGIRHLVEDSDVVHGNGMWEYTNWCTARESFKQRKPYVISFHGSIMNPQQNWGLKHHIAWRALDGRYIKNATCLHACTQKELKAIRNQGIKNAVAVIPNGVNIWDLSDKTAFKDRFLKNQGRKILLFLARVHPSKGVFDLIDAWKVISKKNPEWHLVIAGKLEAACITNVPEKIKDYSIESCTTVAGPLYGQDRLEAYAVADAFVLPSYTEGFSTSILEAMASKLPVVYTDACNFPEVANRGAGLVGPAGVEPLIRNLQKIMSMSDSERQKMGKIARSIIEKQYTWPIIASQWLEVYSWLNGTSPKPVCVHEVNNRP